MGLNKRWADIWFWLVVYVFLPVLAIVFFGNLISTSSSVYSAYLDKRGQGRWVQNLHGKCF